ncbi:hypothetical protein FRACYDRAFT_237395 [Fragilariopsis cylindrus CCMP1102]|uniref:Uncharacterized protein n=1 Tax=Fragilariopsis cylindrus CCMP1102 TaxID=635003 RepID=A0A1E7FLQ9_9STRA|nr:hypothetical protein FRACYDRAFT_237395 [Fragilariopsis cylindrus CCMP1102]|eukprot:OEU19102.1 hypothetical protein FRACYDRAFT_237395 [Fragilariopsis cylindrus CCMP1102]
MQKYLSDFATFTARRASITTNSKSKKALKNRILGDLNDSEEDLDKVWLKAPIKASINGTTVNLAFNEWLNDVLRRPIDDNNNIDNNDQLESDLVSDEVFPCEECCEESSSPPSQPSLSSSSSSKNDLSYYQANRFRAVVQSSLLSPLVAAML